MVNRERIDAAFSTFADYIVMVESGESAEVCLTQKAHADELACAIMADLDELERSRTVIDALPRCDHSWCTAVATHRAPLGTLARRLLCAHHAPTGWLELPYAAPLRELAASKENDENPNQT